MVSETVVFISGSRGIQELGPEATQALDKIIQLGFEIVIGDCYGVDRQVQHYLSRKQYAKHVTVYHIGKKPRNCVPTMKTCYVPSHHQPEKNTEMAKVASFGLAIWDSRSRGTADAIEKMRAKGIQVKVVRQVSTETTLVCRAGTHPRDDRQPAKPMPKQMPMCIECTRARTPEELKAWNGQPNCPNRQRIEYRCALKHE